MLAHRRRGIRGERSGWEIHNPVFQDPEQKSSFFSLEPISSVSRNQYKDTPIPLRYPYFSNNSPSKGPKYGQNPTNNDAVNGDDKDNDDVQDKSCFSIVKNQAMGTSTAHGYPLIFKAERWYGKLFWMLIFLAATGAFLRQASVLIKRYVDAPVAVELQVVSRTYLDFPAVTVCNTNKVRRSTISQSEYRQVLTVDENTPTPYLFPCADEEDFECDNKKQCIKSYLVCDGIRHCSDYSDEKQDCIYGSCGMHQFRCSSGGDMGICISKDLVCDKTVQCYMGEDENECECRNTEYKCKVGGCIPKTKVCDGENHCIDASDEQLTLCDPEELIESGFKCGLTTVYIPQIFVCDDYKDCTNGYDEEVDACAAVVNKPCSDGEFACIAKDSFLNESTTCFPDDFLCDKYTDCEDFLDESMLYCTADRIDPEITNRPRSTRVTTVKFLNGIQTGAVARWEPLRAIDNFGPEQLWYDEAIRRKVDDVFVLTDLKNGEFFAEGKYIITDRVTDDAGNTAEASWNLIVEAVDEIITITGCPENITVPVPGQIAVAVSWVEPTAVSIKANGDVEDVPRRVRGGSPQPGDMFPPGVRKVKYHFETTDPATDETLIAVCNFYVHVVVVDVTPPYIQNCDPGIDMTETIPAPLLGGLQEDGSFNYRWRIPTAVDESGETPHVITQTRDDDDILFYPGRNHVSIEFADNAGNTAKCYFTVTVRDTEPPSVICPSDIEQKVPAGITGRRLQWEEPTVTDLSTRSGEEITLVERSHPRGYFFRLRGLGETIVQYKYEDWAGNSATCTFSVTLTVDQRTEVATFDCRDDGDQIPMWKTCNSVPDCNNGLDELVCGSTGVICSVDHRPCRGDSSKFISQCIPNKAECDFTNNCPNGTDEWYCDFPDDCGDDYYQCPSSHVCIHRYLQCNGKLDCKRGEDEMDCENTATDESPFDDNWYLRYTLKTFPSNIDYGEMAQNFKDNVYQSRGFHRVKGEDPPDWNTFVSFSSTADFSDLRDVLLLDDDEIAVHGHQKEDLILQCTYNEQKCNISKFTRSLDDTYGNCYTFNYIGDGRVERATQSTRASSSYGLKMTLFLEQSEYLSIFGREAGIRVSINPADKVASPGDDGITIRPGSITSIGLRYENVSRLGGKYSDCIPDETEWQDLRQGKVVTVEGERYDRKRCLRACLHGNILSACGCSDTIELDGQRCRISNTSEDLCRQYLRFLHDNNAIGCNCGQACNTRHFTKTVSQSAWPSRIYLQHLLRTIHSISTKTININDMESVQENLVRLEVFYEELNYAVTKDVPAYEEESLFSDIGGTAGLYIGYSLITICEFIILGVAVIRYCCHRADGNGANDNETPEVDTRQKQEEQWRNVYGSTWDFNRGF